MKGRIPSWCTVILLIRVIGLVSHVFGVARVHDERGSTPFSVVVDDVAAPASSPSQPGLCDTKSQSDVLAVRGVTFTPGRRVLDELPHPPSNASAPAPRPERSTKRRDT